MNVKIVAGIIIGIAIIVGILGYGSQEKAVQDQVPEDLGNEDNISISDNNEGKQFSLQLSDEVTAIGP